MDWIMAKGWIRRIVAEMLPDSGGGDGSAVIPAPTEADNGKVLVAQDGAVQWGYGLPVVEITSAEYPESGSVGLSEDEAAQIEAALATGLPAVIKFTYNEIPMVCVGGVYAGAGYTCSAVIDGGVLNCLFALTNGSCWMGWS